MRYIFPRQFQLHNVFTSTIDKNDTTQPFKDYTLREQEIAKSSLAGAVRRQRDATSADLRHISLPKRLRGQAFLLTRRLQKLHCRCSYIKLMNYYCHTLVSEASGQILWNLIVLSNSTTAPIAAALHSTLHLTMRFPLFVERCLQMCYHTVFLGMLKWESLIEKFWLGMLIPLSKHEDLKASRLSK